MEHRPAEPGLEVDGLAEERGTHRDEEQPVHARAAPNKRTGRAEGDQRFPTLALGALLVADERDQRDDAGGDERVTPDRPAEPRPMVSG